jgi:HSP20 family protein
MRNKFLKTMLLATLPMVALHADNNATKIHPLKDDPVVQHFQKLQSEMNRIFDEFSHNMMSDTGFNSNFKMDFPKGFDLSQPDTDLKDKGDSYELKMDIPGMNEKSIKIDVEDNYLSVTAKSEEKKEKKENGKIIHQERHVGMVQRGMTLPRDADLLNYKSSYKDGVLTIDIPKKK